MSQDRSSQASALLGALGVGSMLADIPGIFLEVYRMRRDGTFYQQQDYLAKLHREQTQSEFGLRLMTEERTRAIENSPFRLAEDEVRQLVLAETDGGRLPAFLIAPFVREPADNDKPAYRLPIATSWQRAGWRDWLRRIDGLIERPLYRGDVDLRVIRQVLAGIPTVLVHGAIQGDRRVWPEIVTWDLIDRPVRPGHEPGQRVPTQAIGISLPMIEVSQGPGRDAVAADLDAQDQLARLCTVAVGLLGDWFRIVHYSLPPVLYKLVSSADERQLAAAGGAQALDLAIEYGRRDQATARVEQARVCAESGLYPLAVRYLDQAFVALRTSVGHGSAESFELQRALVEIYDMILAEAPGELAPGKQPAGAIERDSGVRELRGRMWDHTMAVLGFDDSSPGERQ